MIKDIKNVIYEPIKVSPYSFFENENAPDPAQRLFEVFHQTASDETYASRGEYRKSEQHCIFHYTISGCGEVIYNGKHHTVQSGQGFFNVINAKGCGYGYPRGSKEPWEFIVLCFCGAGVRETVEALCKRQSVYEVDTEAFLSLCYDVCSAGEEQRLLAFSRLISMVCPSHSGGIVSDFMRLVGTCVEENPTVSSLASRLGVSREHLSRIYQEKTGESPACYIKRRRYEAICDYIAKGMPFSEIADRMHFPSVQGLSLFFKKMSGISPSEYRKKGYIKI